MDGMLHLDAFGPAADARGAGLSQAADRWGRLAYGAALAFIVNLYASPNFYWPEIFDRARLGVVTSAVCAFAVLMRRVTSGERLRLGGPPAAFLAAFSAMVPLSFVWTISPDRTTEALYETGKLLVVYVAVLNAVDTPKRLRTFLLLGTLATLAPSVGAVQRWAAGDALVEGYRTAWRGNYADPNRLAMGLVLFLPTAIALAGEVKRHWVRALLLFAAVANIAAIVLTHSRSGAVAMAVALGLMLLRGRRKGRAIVVAVITVVALVALAPRSFWTRSESIADYEEDASFAGRERAYAMLKVILEERPLTGVGAGAFIDAWERFAPLSAGGQHLIAHNIFMEILGEEGIVGFGLFSVFCLWLFFRVWGAGRDPISGVDARAILAGLTGYLVCELVNGYSRSFNLYAAFALGVAVVFQAGLHRQLRTAEGARAALRP